MSSDDNPYKAPAGCPRSYRTESRRLKRAHVTLVLGCIALAVPAWVWVAHETPDRFPIFAEIASAMIGLAAVVAIFEGVLRLTPKDD
jgi:hypothetical protein